MCGLVGLVGQRNIAPDIYDALTVLQHRGQDAAGIMTCSGGKFSQRKSEGLVRDVFRQHHMQRMEGELAATIERLLPHIAHIQVADNPGRHEPGTGEINYSFLFAHLDRLGYEGWIGAEYKPKTTTTEGLRWFGAVVN